jgi:hypothetical protein
MVVASPRISSRARRTSLTEGRLAIRSAGGSFAMMPVSGSDLTLKLLDGFRLELRGDALQVAPTVQRLFAFLAVHNRPLQRLFVAGNLGSTATRSTPMPTCAPRCGVFTTSASG